MLKGHVFYKQIFGNPIFALFINTFLNGKNGVSDNYKNGMSLSYSGSTVTVNSGAVCIQGRFLEEDTSTPVSAGTDTAYCKLVIEIDLDKENTETEFNQASYKIVKSTSNYPSLTQTNIVKNNSGVYQYELARFRTGTNGITNFEDKRTFLDFDSIYDAMETEYEAVLQDLKDELTAIQNQSDVFLKSVGGTVEGEIIANGGISGQLIPKLLTNENLNDIKTEGFYYSYGGNTVQNKPKDINNFSLLVIKTGENTTVQIISDSFGNIYTRAFTNNQWYTWRAYYNSDSTLRVILSGAVSGSADFASNGAVTVNTKEVIQKKTITKSNDEIKMTTDVTRVGNIVIVKVTTNVLKLEGFVDTLSSLNMELPDFAKPSRTPSATEILASSNGIGGTNDLKIRSYTDYDLWFTTDRKLWVMGVISCDGSANDTIYNTFVYPVD